ncbi:glycosyltransferase family 39 protein [Azotosporobacter soli]|uniref:ArnT family glycosyltransferase n=1 Tax=Azotosporobacter soli TaxID=3055040 RepID=UPI0031FE88A7
MSNRAIMFLLFAGTLLFNMACNDILPVTDPVESNYALTAKEMLLTGNWLSPQIYGQVWFDKPIMIYWLIAASFKVFGLTEFAARLPAALSSAATVMLAYWFSLKLYRHRQGALYAALVLATALQFWIVARGIITDAVLMLFASLTLAAFYQWWSEREQYWLDLAFVASGLSVLTKGPVGLVLPGLIILLFSLQSKQWGWLRPWALLRGVACFTFVVTPWYLAMYSLHGDAFVQTFLGLHNYVRATVSEHPQDNVWYYYLLLMPIALLPWSGIFLRCLMRIRHTRASNGLFLWLWLGVIIFFYSLMATKYATYAFPALFPAAILIGQRIEEMAQAWSGRREWLWLTIPLGLQAITFAVAAGRIEVQQPALLYSVLALCLMLSVWQQARGKRTMFVPVAVISNTAMVLVTLFCLIAPLVQSRSAKDIAPYFPAETERALIACYGDYPTSAVFYGNQKIVRLAEAKNPERDIWAGKYTMPTQSAAAFLASDRPQYIIVRTKNISDFDHVSYRDMFKEIAKTKDMRLFYRQP